MTCGHRDIGGLEHGRNCGTMIGMRSRPKIRVRIAVILLIGAATALGVFLERHYDLREFRRFVSPDGRHALIVYRRPLVFAAPGQAGDAPGIIVLETAGGTELRRRSVEMVQLVDEPQWTPGRVKVKLLLDWPLDN